MVQYTPEIRQAEFGWSETINFSKEDIARVNQRYALPGTELLSASSSEAETLNGYFRNADADRLSQLAKTFNSTGNPAAKIQAWDEFRKIFAKCTEPGYFEGALVDENTARQLAIANDKLYQTTIKMTKGIAAAAQGIVQAVTGATKTPAAVPAAPAPAPQVREGYTRLTNKEIREIFAIAGGQLTEGPTWDKIKSVGGKLAQKITNKQVNPAALLKHWEYAGRPTDSGIIATILRSNNISDDVIQDIFGAMNIEVNTPAAGATTATTPTTPTTPGAAVSSTPAAAATSATAAKPLPAAEPGPAMNNSQLLKSYEMMTPAQRAQLIKDFEIIDDRDRLATGTNESLRSQRKI
jgi:hypothetical protein